MNISKEQFDAIATEIGDENSPVGIDAKKTHILILHRLQKIQEQMDRLEAKTDAIMKLQSE